MRGQLWSVAALVGSLLPAVAADRLADVLPARAGAPACFQRIYDAAHLKQNPRQAIRAVLLSLRRETNHPANVAVRIRFDQARAEPALIGCSCSWYDSGVNRGEQVEHLVPKFPNDAGVQCLALPEWGVTGEDASLFPIELDPSGRSMTLYARASMSLWVGKFMPEPPELRLGTEDRIFRLDRIDAAGCAGLEQAIPDPDRAD